MAPRDRRDAFPVPAQTREVGIRVGNQVYVPVLAHDAHTAAAQAGVLNAHARAVIVLDRVYAACAAFGAPRTVIWRPTDEADAARHEQKELDHQEALAKKRREKELYEADLAILEAQHRLEATAVFKGRKFEVGDAKIAEKIAKFRAGEAVAREATDGEVLTPEKHKAAAHRDPSLADQLAFRAQELDEEIEKTEAEGKSTERLRAELDVVNGMLRREILKATPR